MAVRRADLERLLTELSQNVVHPSHGLFGPASVSWRVNRELAPLLGGGRAALLQLAHPYVAHAIEQHSPTRDHPQGRFVRTFTYVFGMIFGDLDTALAAARRVHGIHSRIHGPITVETTRYRRGQRYRATDQDAVIWVYATLVDTAVQCHELLIGPLSADEREAYYRESKLFAALFGIEPERLPADWAAFRAYFEQTLASDVLHVTPFARDIARSLLDPPVLAYKPAMAGVRTFTTGLLPSHLRRAFGLPDSLTQQLTFDMATRVLRATIANLPTRLRYFPAYVDAQRRIAGKGPDRLGKLLEELAVRTLPLAS